MVIDVNLTDIVQNVRYSSSVNVREKNGHLQPVWNGYFYDWIGTDTLSNKVGFKIITIMLKQEYLMETSIKVVESTSGRDGKYFEVAVLLLECYQKEVVKAAFVGFVFVHRSSL